MIKKLVSFLTISTPVTAAREEAFKKTGKKDENGKNEDKDI